MKRRITVECLCNNRLDHKTPCCDFFKQMLNDCSVRLVYKEKWNSYGIIIIGSGSSQGINFCPWCGIKLPERIEE